MLLRGGLNGGARATLPACHSVSQPSGRPPPAAVFALAMKPEELSIITAHLSQNCDTFSAAEDETALFSVACFPL